jgi:hypothetical protein
MDLIKKAYVCVNCKHKGVILNAIKKNEVISTDFLSDYVRPLGIITDSKIYKYNIIRDDCDIVVSKKPFECVCEKCGKSSIEYIPTQKFDNVLNFYSAAEPEKWLRGFNGLGKR